jgi:proteasome alpha subunit
MQGSTQQQAYDRGITIFSPDGRLYQVEYAREAVKRGTASIGVRTQGGVVLLADKRLRSPLMEAKSVEKLHKVDSHVGIVSAGHVADARQLVGFARQAAQRNRLRYGEPIGVEALTKQVTDHVQEYTQSGGARPFGTALLVGGIENGHPRLYEADPSGTPHEWKAATVGEDRAQIQDTLETTYQEGLAMKDGIDLALQALAASSDDRLTPEGIGLATVDAESGQFLFLDRNERRDHLEASGLLTGDE